jgi:uracil-DNA glycosylase family 4
MSRAPRREAALFPRTLDEVRAEAERLAGGAGGLTPGRLVFGEGNPRARVVLVGEAPGETEERLARPFVGRAGKLLDELLGEAGLARGDVWITNVVKVRPTTGEGRARRNRPPRAGEVRAWLPLLDAELAAIGPGLALGLGAFAGRALVGGEFQLTRDRGVWLEGRPGIPALVTYHPAYILRQQGEALAETRRLAADDFRAVRSRLDALTG